MAWFQEQEIIINKVLETLILVQIMVASKFTVIQKSNLWWEHSSRRKNKILKEEAFVQSIPSTFSTTPMGQDVIVTYRK